VPFSRFVRTVVPSLLASLLCCASAAGAQELKISHQWPEGTDARDRAARMFAQEVEMRAQGLRFSVHGASSLKIPPDKLFDALTENKLDAAIFPLASIVDKVPEFSLARIPGLVASLDAAQSLKGSDIHVALQRLAEAHGLRIVTWWWAPGGFFAKDREVAGPQSVKGRRLRGADPLFDRMLKAAGAAVLAMPSPELAGAMQAGKLDAVGTTYEAFMSLKMYDQAKYATIGSPNLFMGFSPLVMSLAAWNKLTPQQQSAVEEAAEISNAYFDATQRTIERQLVGTLRKGGIKVSRLTRDQYLEWLELGQRTAWVEYTKVNPGAQDLLVRSVKTVLDSLGPTDDGGDKAGLGAVPEASDVPDRADPPQGSRR
jgi:TRAP-type C4-dicarboxylate transport system substrate-binding protein